MSGAETKAAPADAGAERFTSRKQALEWLRASGYKVSQGKFYQDCAAGYPFVNRDGSVSKFQVLEYGQKLDLQAKSAAAVAAASREWDDRQIKANAEIAEMKAERMRREEDRFWLHAVDAWAQVAALVGALRDNIRHQLFIGQREIVQVAGGDQDRSQEVSDFCDQLVARAFNETAGETINLKFERKTDAEEKTRG